MEGKELFSRHPANPIIQTRDLPNPANSVFNPAATRVGNEIVLLMRVEDRRGISHFTGAHIWISFSPDLKHRGDHQILIPARRGAWWDANKIGL